MVSKKMNIKKHNQNFKVNVLSIPEIDGLLRVEVKLQTRQKGLFKFQNIGFKYCYLVDFDTIGNLINYALDDLYFKYQEEQEIQQRLDEFFKN